eukprot:350629-Chlamydomonas_euryale.AAC.2
MERDGRKLALSASAWRVNAWGREPRRGRGGWLKGDVGKMWRKEVNGRREERKGGKKAGAQCVRLAFQRLGQTWGGRGGEQGMEGRGGRGQQEGSARPPGADTCRAWQV